MPMLPHIIARVGKSGPLMNAMRSDTLASGCSMRYIVPSMTSPRLCGGMFVAIPTAIPTEPFTSRFGIREGSTVGS